MHKYFWAYVVVMVMGACSHEKNASEGSDLSLSGDTITVLETSPLLVHLISEKSSFRDFSPRFSAVGIVRPVAGKIAEIAPPFEGRIVRSFVNLGQKVWPGSPVFEFNSPELNEVIKAYFVAQSANEYAQRIYNRQKELSSNGVSSQRDLEQSQNEAIIANREFEQAKATLELFHIDSDKIQLGQPSKVVSPILGEVVKSNITLGSYVKEDTGPLVVVADLSHVWVVAQVKEHYSGRMHAGDSVEVVSNANPGEVIHGKVHYISEILDEETRSVEVIIDCENAGRNLKLGMFCDVRFSGISGKAIILPATSIMKEQDNDFVLVEQSKGKYVRRIVESEAINLNEVYIKSGLKEGEQVVIKGGIYLNL